MAGNIADVIGFESCWNAKPLVFAKKYTAIYTPFEY